MDIVFTLRNNDGTPATGKTSLISISYYIDGVVGSSLSPYVNEIGSTGDYILTMDTPVTAYSNIRIYIMCTGCIEKRLTVYSESSSDLSSLATAAALASVASDVTDIKVKTDNLPSNPVDTSDLPSDYAKPGDEMTLTSAYDAAKTASQLTSSDLAGLSTFDPISQTVQIDATQAAGFATATDIATAIAGLNDVTAQEIWEYSTGARSLTTASLSSGSLATQSDLSGISSGSGLTAQEVWEYPQGRTLTSGALTTGFLATQADISSLSGSGNTGGGGNGGLTAQQVWEYQGVRSITSAALGDGTYLALSTDLPTDVSSDVSSIAYDLSVVASNVSDIKDKTDNLPASPAATGDAMTLTQDYDAAKTASQLTSADLSGLSTFDPTLQDVSVSSDSVSAIQAGLSTFDPAEQTVLLDSTQLESLATPSDIPTSDIAAIKTKVDSLSNTDITSLATSASLSTLSTIISSIKSKTDNLPSNPAAKTDIPAMITAGAIATEVWKEDNTDAIVEAIMTTNVGDMEVEPDDYTVKHLIMASQKSEFVVDNNDRHHATWKIRDTRTDNNNANVIIATRTLTLNDNGAIVETE